jgi:hypothetical protein
MFTKGQLIGALVSFKENCHLGLLEEPAILDEMCIPSELPLVLQMSAIVSELMDAFDYSKSPEFLHSIAGKSAEFRTMKLRMITPMRRTETRKRLGDAIAGIQASDAVFDLVEESRHEKIWRLRILLAETSNRPDSN